MSRNAMPILCGGLLLALLVSLQGCGPTEEEQALTAGTSVEKSFTEEMTDTQVQSLQTDAAALVEDPTNKESLGKVIATLQEFLSGAFDAATDEATVIKEDGLLKINISMVKLDFLSGLVKVQRSETDKTKGPIFAMQLPIQGNKLDPLAITKDIMKTTKVHIEGYANIVMFVMGYIKLLIGKEGYKFYMEFAQMMMWKLFKSQGMIAISDKNVFRTKGSLASWFTEEWAKEIAKYVRASAEPMTNELAQAKKELQDKKDDCPDNWLLNEACKLAIDVLNAAVTEVEKNLGGAAEAIGYLVEKAGELFGSIFTLHTAAFDFEFDPNNPGDACLDLELEVTALGKKIEATGDEKMKICLDKMEEEVVKIAKMFFPTVFTEIEKGNKYVQEAQKKGEYMINSR